MAIYTEASRDRLRDRPQAEWRVAGLGLTRKIEGFSELTAVKAELESIIKVGEKGVLPGEMHFDAAFNAPRMRDALDKGYPVLHIASHFVFRPGTEADSFLLLGDGARLTLRDLRDDDYRFRDVDLITLSACETALGGGQDANGLEIEGFGALAQKQGARGVIATLWPVADESTGIFMQQFYRLRQEKKLTKAEAMRQVQTAFIRGSASSASGTYSHPYFWAPFILMGNWL
jgi:CHAT domain-containing protein